MRKSPSVSSKSVQLVVEGGGIVSSSESKSMVVDGERGVGLCNLAVRDLLQLSHHFETPTPHGFQSQRADIFLSIISFHVITIYLLLQMNLNLWTSIRDLTVL
jgi:hypothetical protein